MKKLVTLLLAAGMVLGSFAGAQAIDFKVKGDWRMEYGLYDGLKLQRDESRTNKDTRYGNGGTGRRDTFEAGQRVNLVLEAVASEHLSGTVHFEMGAMYYGRTGTLGDRTFNGALGQRGASVGLRDAYLDWFVPNTDLKIRMGFQPIATPGFVWGSSVFAETAAGISASYKFNDNASLAAFWARPYNDNYNGGDNAVNEMDNVDMFGLMVPLRFDGFRVTPYGMIAGIGPNSPIQQGFATNPTTNRVGLVQNGMQPAYYATNNRRAASGSKQYATAWWGGLTGEITTADPFRFAWDAVYGEVSYADTGYLNRKGYFLAVLAEYKLDWGVPGIYGWYASGDNNNPKDGSERMPVFEINDGNTSLSSMAFYGGYVPVAQPGSDGIMGQTGFAGTWGIGVRIRDMSFMEDLKHVVRLNFFGGTNSPTMAKYILGKKTIPGAAPGGRLGGTPDFNTGDDMYLTQLDYAMELNVDTSYKIYENLEMILELGYMHLWLDQSKSMWGSSRDGTIRGVSTTDAVKAMLVFRYRF